MTLLGIKVIKSTKEEFCLDFFFFMIIALFISKYKVRIQSSTTFNLYLLNCEHTI